MRNDVIANRNVIINNWFAITKTPSIDPKNLPQNLLFAKDNVTNILLLTLSVKFQYCQRIYQMALTTTLSRSVEL